MAIDSAAPSRPPRAKLARTALRRMLPWLIIIGIFVFWAAAVRVFRIEEFILPAPSAVFASGWQWRWPILDNAWQTLMTTVIGFAFAVIVGLVAGIGLGASTLIYDGFYPA